MPRRSNRASRSINPSRGTLDKIVVSLFRYATTDHTGLGRLLDYVPPINFVDTLKHIQLMSTVEKLLNEAGINLLPTNPSHDDLYKKESYRSEPKYFIVVFPAFMTNRWVCQVDFEQDKVTHHELRFVD